MLLFKTDNDGYIKPVICALRFCILDYSLLRGSTSKTTTKLRMVFVSQNGHRKDLCASFGCLSYSVALFQPSSVYAG